MANESKLPSPSISRIVSSENINSLKKSISKDHHTSHINQYDTFNDKKQIIANDYLPNDIKLTIQLIEKGKDEGATSFLHIVENMFHDEIIQIKRSLLNPFFYFSKYKNYSFYELMIISKSSKLSSSSYHMKYYFCPASEVGSIDYYMYMAKYATRRPILTSLTMIMDQNTGKHWTIAETYLKVIEMNDIYIPAWLALAKLCFRNDSISQAKSHDGWNITQSNFRIAFHIHKKNEPNTNNEKERIEIANYLWKLKDYLNSEERSYVNYLKYHYDIYLDEERSDIYRIQLSTSSSLLLNKNNENDLGSTFPVYLPPSSSSSSTARSKSVLKKKTSSSLSTSSLYMTPPLKKKVNTVSFQLETIRSMPDMRLSSLNNDDEDEKDEEEDNNNRTHTNETKRYRKKKESKHFHDGPSLPRVLSMY